MNLSFHIPPVAVHQMVQSFVKHGNADIRIAAIGTACAGERRARAGQRSS